MAGIRAEIYRLVFVIGQTAVDAAFFTSKRSSFTAATSFTAGSSAPVGRTVRRIVTIDDLRGTKDPAVRCLVALWDRVAATLHELIEVERTPP